MNIDFNRLNELTKRYRASLSNLNENEQSLYELILRNYDYLDEDAYFYTLNTERLVTASNQTQQIKDLQALTYYNHKLLNDLKKFLSIKTNNFNEFTDCWSNSYSAKW